MHAHSVRCSTTDTSRLLRGHLVRRVPTREELRQRVPIVLTNRDQKLLVSVYLHGLLPTELIELAHYPPVTTRGSHSTQAYDRLRQLWLCSYLERIERPVARIIGGRRPFLYALGPRAVSLVAARLQRSVDTIRRRRLDRLDALFLEHDLQAALLWAHLEALLRPRGTAVLTWIPSVTSARAALGFGIRKRGPGYPYFLMLTSALTIQQAWSSRASSRLIWGR